jgi:hypothetical protein
MKNIYFIILLLITLVSFYSIKNKNLIELKFQKSNKEMVAIQKEQPQSKFISNNINYKDLSETEKNIVDNFLKNNLEIEKALKYNNPNYRDALLKYYDKDTSIISISNGKSGDYLEVYDLKTWKKINSNELFVQSNQALDPFHMVVVNVSKIFYFSSGMRDFSVVNNSELLNKNETYVKQSDIIDNYEFALDKKTNILKISVFKNENKSDTPNTKLREVEFVLP